METIHNHSLISSVLNIQQLADLPTGVIQLNDLKSIRIEGEDAEPFLQSQFSNDVSALRVGGQQIGAYCNPKGRILAIYRLLRDNSGFHMVLPNDLVEMIAKRLILYRMRARVNIRIDEETRLAGYIGNVPDAPNMYVLDHFRALTVCDRGSDRNDTTHNDNPVLPNEFWKLATILAGEPQVYATTTEQFIPQQVNLDLIDGVSFKKGCYPGQEIVARIRYLGKIKQRMFSAKIDATTADTSPGDPLFFQERPDQKIGIVVDSVRFEETVWLTTVVSVNDLNKGGICLGTANRPPLTLLPLLYSVTTERNSEHYQSIR